MGNTIIAHIRANPDNLLYLFQVENIIKEYKDQYKDVLAEHIQDHYIEHSETVEASINNNIAQKVFDKTLLLHMAGKDKFNLDDWIYDYGAEENLSDKIKKKLRFGNNTQSSLDKYLHRYNFRGLQAEITDLLEYEIDEAVIDYMSSEVFVASESTLSRVTQEVYDIIRETYAEEGEGTYKVADAIQEKFDTLADYESERIARTETLKAQGHATWKRLVNNPDVEYYQWSATNDERTRDSHIEIDGEITYADGTGVFSNGLAYPGDTNGDIEEWINCRCDLVGYVPELGFVPPPGESNWYEDEMLFDTSLDIPEVYVELDEYLASYW